MSEWVCSTLIFLILTSHRGNCENVIEKNIGDFSEMSFIDDQSVIDCVVDLTQIVTIFKPTILILENEKDDYDDKFYNKVIETFAKRNLAVTIQDKMNYEVNKELDVYEGNVHVIAHFKNIDDLLRFDLGNFNKQVKYLVIISELEEDYIVKLQCFGQQFIKQDVTFIIQDLVAQKHDVITFLPAVNAETCQVTDIVDPIRINICSNGSLETNLVFRFEPWIDFKNCSIKVGMATMFPFSQIPDEKKLKNYDIIHNIAGSDVEIIKIMANYLNASIVWHYLRREQQNPFTDTEYMEFLKNGSVEVSAGGLYRIYGDLVLYSGIYARQAVIWVYSAHRNSRSWVNLIQKLHGLSLFYLFYLVYSVSSYLFRRFDLKQLPFRDILLYSWGSLIGGSSLPEPTSLKHKMLNIFYLFLCIFLSVYINIQLVSFLTIDGPSITFKTNDDVVDSGRTPYLNDKNKYFIEDNKYLAFANTSKSCSDFIDCIYKAIEGDGLTAILDEYFYPSQASTAVNDEAKILRATQNIVTVYHEMLIKKDSVITLGVQKVLVRLFEAGICDHLFKEAIGLTVVAKADSANKNAVSNSYSCESGCAITLAQVAGVFYAWAIGCFLSVGALLFEILWKRQTIGSK